MNTNLKRGTGHGVKKQIVSRYLRFISEKFIFPIHNIRNVMFPKGSYFFCPCSSQSEEFHGLFFFIQLLRFKHE